MTKFLIIEARFYPEIADELSAGAIAILQEADVGHDLIEVPGVLEIPTALAIAYDAKTYNGFVVLGCVIRGETSHYDIVANESARAIQQFGVENRVPVGNGILTVETRDQANIRADRKGKNKGADAARAALELFALKNQFGESKS